MYKYTSELRADELGTNRGINIAIAICMQCSILLHSAIAIYIDIAIRPDELHWCIGQKCV
jgi:hypothetical protein